MKISVKICIISLILYCVFTIIGYIDGKNTFQRDGGIFDRRKQRFTNEG